MSGLHKTSVESNYMGDSVFAVCVCGWTGKNREFKFSAKREARKHIKSVTKLTVKVAG